MKTIGKKDYNKVRPLFGELEAFQPMCAAVLAGVWPGQVWVDDPEKPASVLLLTFLSGGGAGWCFLAGEPGNQEFNAALNQALFEEKIAGKEAEAFLFTCHPSDWNGQLEVVGNPRLPAPMKRQHYLCRQLAYDWCAYLPEGYAIIPIETGLLKRDDLTIPSPIKTTLGKWISIRTDQFRDYGFAALYENQVVAWATVDFVTSGVGDLGFETLPEHRRRGLGSAVAAAALEQGLARGLTIHWTCADDNLGSQRTAARLGLERGQDYVMYLFAVDVHTHTAQLAYSKLAAGQYQQAIELYEQLFAQKADVPNWAYFDTAQAYAALGNAEKALQYLRMAAKEGWPAAEITAQTLEFQILHGTPEWDAVIEQIRKNQQN
jgi:GNAT superfamily N-acetyltransferase